MAFTIREAGEHDLEAVLSLYRFLHEETPPLPGRAAAAWAAICADKNHHALLAELDGSPVSSCILVVIPNLTRSARPYGLIENVVSHPDFRGRGYATALLQHASAIAEGADCYKVMLLTGRKDTATLNFYQGAGFNSQDKTAFIQWL